MSDLVDRLRAGRPVLNSSSRRNPTLIELEAAQEVDRLRAEVERLVGAVGEHVTVRGEYLARAEKAEAERDEARRERDEARERIGHWISRLETAEAALASAREEIGKAKAKIRAELAKEKLVIGTCEADRSIRERATERASGLEYALAVLYLTPEAEGQEPRHAP